MHSEDPYVVLDTNLRRTATALQKWGQRKLSGLGLQLQIAHEIILRLDQAQDHRLLSSGERRLRALLKGKCLALASLERIRQCERARITYLREGDANTKYFHMKANARRRKKLIPRLSHGGRVATSQEDKLEMLGDYFTEIMGSPASAAHPLRLHALSLPSLLPSEAAALEAPFLEDEVRIAIMAMPAEKAPGPDGFSGLFYKLCWPTIKGDLLNAIAKFHSGNAQNFHKLNSANLTLLPKKDEIGRAHV